MAKGCVLLLGRLNHDGIRTTLDSFDLTSKRKLLITRPANLHSIADILEAGSVDDEKLTAVVMLLTEFTMIDTLGAAQGEAYKRIFDLIPKYPHAVFVYEDNLAGRFTTLTDGASAEQAASTTRVMDAEDVRTELEEETDGDEWDLWDRPPRYWFDVRRFCMRREVAWDPNALRVRAWEFVSSLLEKNYNLVPFKTRKEVAILLQKFIGDTAEGTVLEVYVPRERVLAEEFDRFVTLFHKYLIQVRGLSVVLDRDLTSSSLMYRFKGEGLRPGDLTNEMDGFASFLMSTGVGGEAVMTILRSANLSEAQSSRLQQEFRRDWRRLRMDMQVSFERALVELRAKYLEAVLDAEEENEYGAVVGALDTANPLAFLPWSGTPVVINSLNVQMGGTSMRIGKVENKGGQNTFADHINNSIFGYNQADKDVLNAIDTYAGDADKPILKNAVTALNDPSLSVQEKLPIFKKVQTFFLKKVMPQVGETAVKVLVGLLEKKIGISD